MVSKTLFSHSVCVQTIVSNISFSVKYYRVLCAYLIFNKSYNVYSARFSNTYYSHLFFNTTSLVSHYPGWHLGIEKMLSTSSKSFSFFKHFYLNKLLTQLYFFIFLYLYIFQDSVYNIISGAWSTSNRISLFSLLLLIQLYSSHLRWKECLCKCSKPSIPCGE